VPDECQVTKKVLAFLMLLEMKCAAFILMAQVRGKKLREKRGFWAKHLGRSCALGNSGVGQYAIDGRENNIGMRIYVVRTVG
jgi:hypothetical protein